MSNQLGRPHPLVVNLPGHGPSVLPPPATADRPRHLAKDQLLLSKKGREAAGREREQGWRGERYISH